MCSLFSSLTLDDLRNIATLVAACVALIGVWPVFRNLRASERNLRSKVYLDTLSLLEGKDNEVRALRKKLDAELQKARPAQGGGTTPVQAFNVLKASPDIQKDLDQLARVYDKVGLLVKHGVVPTDFLFDFYSCPIILAWQHIKPLVAKERDSRLPPQPNHMLKFEILAIGAALYRQTKYGDTPPFAIGLRETALWNRWRPWRVGPSTATRPDA
jgi:hypothetical protein